MLLTAAITFQGIEGNSEKPRSNQPRTPNKATAGRRGVKSNIAPVVRITSPSDGSIYSPLPTIEVTAEASDKNGSVRFVRFYAGSTQIGVDRKGPYRARWSDVPAGTHLLTAVAIDNRGAATTSAAVQIVVKAPNVPPTVKITSPVSGGTYTAPASIALDADAADSDGGVAKVEFFAGTTLIGSAASAPYSAVWNDVPAGTYSVTAVATDTEEATAQSVAVSITVNPAPPPADGDGDISTAPLVQPADLIYEGAFRVPSGSYAGPNLTDWQKIAPVFNFGGTALSFNPATNSLFLVGHDWVQLVAEIGIPQILQASTVDELETAPVLQPLTDVTDRLMDNAHPGATLKIGGLLPYGNELYASVFDYYDDAGTQILSHFVSGLDLSVPDDARGPFQVGTIGAGFVSGYFARVPVPWQTALGGPVLNGNCCLPIIGRTSSGPAVFTIDPLDLGAADPVPATPLVYYPLLHPLAPGDTQNPLFNLTTEITGVVFPEGTRSVLFFGRHGLGEYCYGTGGASGGDCVDPESESKGTHAYPYDYYVWAYDANDLAAVKAGQNNPWDVQPYAVWSLPLPLAAETVHVLGAAYDAATGRIFVSQAKGDGELPVIHVLTVRRP